MTTVEAAVEFYAGHRDEVIQIAEIPIAEIDMPGFQRERKLHHITKIAAEYDATAYAFPMVAVFKGCYVCLDGQQRLAAVERNGEEMAAVLLVAGIATPERLAELFLKVNRDRKLLNALEKYIGAFSAKDRGTMEIDKIVSEFNLEVAKSASANGKVPAGAVTAVHEQGGGELLRRVLNVREAAWGANGSREANEGKTLIGLAKFLKRYWEKVDDEHLITVLRRHHPGYILQAIDKRRGISQTLTYSDYVREQYNRGRRGRGKL